MHTGKKEEAIMDILRHFKTILIEMEGIYGMDNKK